MSVCIADSRCSVTTIPFADPDDPLGSEANDPGDSVDIVGPDLPPGTKVGVAWRYGYSSFIGVFILPE